MENNIPSEKISKNSSQNVQEELMELKKSYEYKQKTGALFVERMQYDFNTLLNSITGYLYAVYEAADHTQKPSVDNALKTAKVMLGKFDGMTDYLSLIFGGYAQNKAPSSIRLMLRQINQEADEALFLKNLDFVCEIDEKLPEYVEIDYAIVKKSLFMLVENAIQNTPKGKVSVYVSLESITETGGKHDIAQIKFSVLDEGVGINEEAIGALLRGEARRQSLQNDDPAELHGFGLQMAKDFLAFAGATLDAENNEDKGAVFSFVLNAEIISKGSQKYEKNESHETQGASEKHHASEPVGALDNIRVLLADDSVIMQQIVRQMLENEGARVTVVSNGNEAVSAFNEGSFNVILMDIEMPQLNGYDAARQITDGTAASAPPVIGMTAHTGKEEHEKCMQSGMVSTIIKPFKHKALIDAIYKELYGKEYVETSAETEAPEIEKSSIYNFASIKGIDYREGLKRLGGNEKVYFELLQNFRDGYSDVSSNISMLIMEGNDNEVKNLLHLIKGISGNLSFNEVYDFSNKLKEAVDSDNIADITSYLKLFKDAFDEFKTSFAQAEVEILYNMAENLDVDAMLVKNRIEDLRECLRGDIDLGNAIDACDDIYDYVKATDNKRDFDAIRDAVNSFDLETASALLDDFALKFEKL